MAGSGSPWRTGGVCRDAGLWRVRRESALRMGAPCDPGEPVMAPIRGRGVSLRPWHVVAALFVVVVVGFAADRLSSATETRVIAGDARPGPLVVGSDSGPGDTASRSALGEASGGSAEPTVSEVIPVPESWDVPGVAAAPEPPRSAVPEVIPVPESWEVPGVAAAPEPPRSAVPKVVPVPQVGVPAVLPVPEAWSGPEQLPIPEPLPVPVPVPERLPVSDAPPTPPVTSVVEPPPVLERPVDFAAAESRNVAKADERARVTALPDVAQRLAALGESEQRMGVREPVRFTARTGAVLSVEAGRCAVTGSVQAPVAHPLQQLRGRARSMSWACMAEVRDTAGNEAEVSTVWRASGQER